MLQRRQVPVQVRDIVRRSVMHIPLCLGCARLEAMGEHIGSVKLVGKQHNRLRYFLNLPALDASFERMARVVHHPLNEPQEEIVALPGTRAI